MEDLKKSTQKLLTAGMVVPIILGGMFLLLHLDVTREHLEGLIYPLLALVGLFFVLKIVTDHIRRVRAIYFLRCFALTNICIPWLSILMYSFFRWDPVEFGFLALAMMATGVAFVIQYPKRLNAVAFAEQENINNGVFDPVRMSWHPTKEMVVVSTNAGMPQNVRDARKLWFLPIIAIVAARLLFGWLGSISYHLVFYLLLFLPLTEVGRFSLYFVQYVFVGQLEQKYKGKFMLSKNVEG